MRIISILLLSFLLATGATGTFADSGKYSRSVTISISLSIPDRVVPERAVIEACAERQDTMFSHASTNCRTPRSLLQTVRYDDNVTVRVTPI